MNTLISNLNEGLKNTKGGYGIRKIMAIFSIVVACLLSIAFTTAVLIFYPHHNIYVLGLIIIWILLALLLFGLITSEQIIALKNGNK